MCVGFAILFTTSPKVSPQVLSISGMVTGVDERSKVSFITFIPDDFLVVSFDKAPPIGNVTLHGRLQQYEGKVEFVVQEYD